MPANGLIPSRGLEAAGEHAAPSASLDLSVVPGWTPPEGADYRLKDLVATALQHQAAEH